MTLVLALVILFVNTVYWISDINLDKPRMAYGFIESLGNDISLSFGYSSGAIISTVVKKVLALCTC